MKKLNLENYTFSNVDGIITYVNNTTGATGQPTAKGKIKIILLAGLAELSVAELLAIEGWHDVVEAIADAPADAPAETLKSAKKEAESAAIAASIAATKDRNNTALAPLNARLAAKKKAWLDAAAADTDMDGLQIILSEIKSAIAALAAFTPEINENEEKISNTILLNEAEIENFENAIKSLKIENKDLKKMLGYETEKKSTETGTRNRYTEFTWEMGEKIRTMKNDGKTGKEIEDAVDCSYGSYQRSLGRAKDGFKPYHPVYANKPTLVTITNF